MARAINANLRIVEAGLSTYRDDEPMHLRRSRLAEILKEPSSDNMGWSEAVEDFLKYVMGTRSESTTRYYYDRLSVATRWMVESARDGTGVRLADFKAKDMREYLHYRLSVINDHTGERIKESTRRHDAVAMKAFMKFAVREAYIVANPLADYMLPKADQPYRKSPLRNEIDALLSATSDRWYCKTNPEARFVPPKARTFFARRNLAILATLISTGMRIGEALRIKLDDYQPEKGLIAIPKSKGRRPRDARVEPECIAIIDAWLKARPKCQSDYLFITAYATEVKYKPFLHSFKRDLQFAKLDGSGITLHGLRHYAITSMANISVKAAKEQVGHRNIATTNAYLHDDAEHVKEVHRLVAPLGKIMVNKRTEAQKRTRVI